VKQDFQAVRIQDFMVVVRDIVVCFGILWFMWVK